MTRLAQLAKTIRSKNAGVDLITFDIIFADRESYLLATRSGALTRETITRLYRVRPDEITHFVFFEAANAIKFTLRRASPSGSPGDSDIFGAQQYAPLLDIEIPGSPPASSARQPGPASKPPP
jgi:uncharacterized protein DUF4387